MRTSLGPRSPTRESLPGKQVAGVEDTCPVAAEEQDRRDAQARKCLTAWSLQKAETVDTKRDDKKVVLTLSTELYMMSLTPMSLDLLISGRLQNIAWHWKKIALQNDWMEIWLSITTLNIMVPSLPQRAILCSQIFILKIFEINREMEVPLKLTGLTYPTLYSSHRLPRFPGRALECNLLETLARRRPEWRSHTDDRGSRLQWCQCRFSWQSHF